MFQLAKSIAVEAKPKPFHFLANKRVVEPLWRNTERDPRVFYFVLTFLFGAAAKYS